MEFDIKFNYEVGCYETFSYSDYILSKCGIFHNRIEGTFKINGEIVCGYDKIWYEDGKWDGSYVLPWYYFNKYTRVDSAVAKYSKGMLESVTSWYASGAIRARRANNFTSTYYEDGTLEFYGWDSCENLSVSDFYNTDGKLVRKIVKTRFDKLKVIDHDYFPSGKLLKKTTKTVTRFGYGESDYSTTIEEKTYHVNGRLHVHTAEHDGGPSAEIKVYDRCGNLLFHGGYFWRENIYRTVTDEKCAWKRKTICGHLNKYWEKEGEWTDFYI